MEQFLGGLEILAQWQNFLIIPLGLAIGIVYYVFRVLLHVSLP